MKKLYLICNAHIDPVWQWEWEEGAAAAVSTFRTAADFCEEYEGFIFNHNEALLYKWIEEYEPSLFKRIQDLVRRGEWHIIGGWYLQPDCNMPSGESFVRQIILGKKYFKEKFGVEPTTAVNFDSFGHTRGLVQIMKKSGYDSYLFFRPDQQEFELPGQDFTWVGYDGSRIAAHRVYDGYNSLLGRAAQKVANWMKANAGKPVGLVTWGVGNHGGGPSRIDLKNLNGLMQKESEYEIIHSTPEEYFKGLSRTGNQLPEYEKDLNPCNVGCYTSQIRIKQKHRLLENELYMLEKIVSAASLQEYMSYPEKELEDAFCDLMTAQFHDVLPGSSVQPVEEASLRLMDHALEIVSRLRARAFFALAAGQDKVKDGEIPILIYNPHPFKVKGIFECEFMLADQNHNDEFTLPIVYKDGKQIPSQPEKELSNISIDWRKRVVFAAELEPSQMNRFDCRLVILPGKPRPYLNKTDNNILFKTDELTVVVNCNTGLIDKYVVNGHDYLKENSFMPIVIEDYDDSWATTLYSFSNICGKFELMVPEEGTYYSGIKGKTIDSVRVIEDGEVRTVIEVVFKYGQSFICQKYKLPKQGTEFEVETRVNWNEKTKMLKLSIPTMFKNADYLRQVAYGIERLSGDRCEVVSQKWSGVVSKQENRALSCINDGVYGSDYKDGEIRISLIRSPGYTALDIKGKHIMADDRYSPRIDQGERVFNFWFNGRNLEERLEKIDREALVRNEKPFILSFFPSGEGEKPLPAVILNDDAIQMTAFKKAESTDDYIIRLFEPTGDKRCTTICIPFLDIEKNIELSSFEIKTIKVDIRNKCLEEVNLMEK